MFREKHIQVNLSFPYYTLGNIDEKTNYIWMVFHGYGQLARYFIQKFEPLAQKGGYVIAPQGLSKFYLSGFEGRVGATWMTKENRYTEIANQRNFLDRIYQEEVKFKSIPLGIIGFSQGVTTACRWIATTQLPIKRLILWAGEVPIESTAKDFEFLEDSCETYYVLGKKDFYLQNKEEVHLALNKQLAVFPLVQKVSFEGGHHIDSDTLLKIVKL